METLSLSQIGHVQLTPTLWANFPDINDVEPLNDKDHAVLEKHGAVDRFGVNLIHRHFDICENEFLLESTDHDQRIQITKVYDRNEMKDSSKFIQTQWVFNGEMGTDCKMYCKKDNYGHFPDHERVGV